MGESDYKLKFYYDETKKRIDNLKSKNPIVKLLIEKKQPEVLSEELFESTMGERIDVTLAVDNGTIQIVSAKKVKYTAFSSGYEKVEESEYDINLLDKVKVLKEYEYTINTILPIMERNIEEIDKCFSIDQGSINLDLYGKNYKLNPNGWLFIGPRFSRIPYDDETSHGEVLYDFVDENVLVKKISNQNFVNDIISLFNYLSKNRVVVDVAKIKESLSIIIFPEIEDKKRFTYNKIHLKGIHETYTFEQYLQLYDMDEEELTRLSDSIDKRLSTFSPFEFITIDALEARITELNGILKDFPSDEEISEKNAEYRREYQEALKKQKKHGITGLFHKEKEPELKVFTDYLGYKSKEEVIEQINNTRLRIKKRQEQEEMFREINNDQLALAARRIMNFKKILKYLIKYDANKVMKR